ncbi:MAG: class I SAM-dependent methyltransferase [Patescibacteria group bacterium]
MKKRQVSSAVYTKEYYEAHFSGFEEFREHRGKDLLDRLLELIKSKKNIKILDIGCGQGDLAIYFAQRGAHVTGIDYSKDAITLAKQNLAKQKTEIKDRVLLVLMDASRVNFPENYFDAVLAVDVFEHLYPEVLEPILKKISTILKKSGELLVHTEANKIYLNFTHKWIVYPISSFLIAINKIFTKKNYPNLSRDPRNDLHKIQHVNEPTYYYLSNLFKKFKFKGKIYPIVPYKSVLSWKDIVYNILVWFYPFSKFWPLHLLFAYDYICIMRNNK